MFLIKINLLHMADSPQQVLVPYPKIAKTLLMECRTKPLIAYHMVVSPGFHVNQREANARKDAVICII